MTDRLTCHIPPAFLGRNVTVTIVKDRSRWLAVGADRVGNHFPLTFDGFTGSPRFATKAGCAELLATVGAMPGLTLWATPAPC